jgi:hypothetical protein
MHTATVPRKSWHERSGCGRGTRRSSNSQRTGRRHTSFLLQRRLFARECGVAHDAGPDGSVRRDGRAATDLRDELTGGSSQRAIAYAREQYALSVAYSCAIENGDAHRKNFSVIYENPQEEVRFAPAYDILSTTPYIPLDTLALTLNGTKQFPMRHELLKFIRFVIGKSEQAANEILDKVAHGVSVAAHEAHQYAEEHPDAQKFVDRLTRSLTRGLDRLAA